MLQNYTTTSGSTTTYCVKRPPKTKAFYRGQQRIAVPYKSEIVNEDGTVTVRYDTQIHGPGALRDIRIGDRIFLIFGERHCSWRADSGYRQTAASIIENIMQYDPKSTFYLEFCPEDGTAMNGVLPEMFRSLAHNNRVVPFDLRTESMLLDPNMLIKEYEREFERLGHFFDKTPAKQVLQNTRRWVAQIMGDAVLDESIPIYDGDVVPRMYGHRMHDSDSDSDSDSDNVDNDVSDSDSISDSDTWVRISSDIETDATFEVCSDLEDLDDDTGVICCEMHSWMLAIYT